MKFRFIIIFVVTFGIIQNAQPFWIVAAVKGAKTVINNLTESKNIESAPKQTTNKPANN